MLNASTILLLAVTLGVILLVSVVIHIRSDGPPLQRSAAVVVLGDIGRSPRIMYHAQSFANNDFETFVIGYEGQERISTLLLKINTVLRFQSHPFPPNPPPCPLRPPL